MGFIVYSIYSQALIREELGNLKEVTLEDSLNILSSIRALRGDVEFLSKTPPVQGIIRTSSVKDVDPYDGSTEAQWKDRLDSIFREFIRTKPMYMQIRFIGIADKGRELVRVDRENDVIISVPKEQLQQKIAESYMQETIKKEPGSIYLSEINLNREHGKIMVPHTPVIRAAVPVYSAKNEIFGIVVINLNFGLMIKQLQDSMVPRHSVYLVNDSGAFLLHRDPTLFFGFEFGRITLVQDDIPELKAMFEAENIDTDRSLLFKPKGTAIHYHKIFFDPDHPRRHLGLMIETSYQELLSESSILQTQSFIGILLLIFSGSVLAYFLTRQLTRPLQQITQSARSVAEGDYEVYLPEKVGGEVGILMGAFRVMIQRVKERTRLLQENEARTNAIVTTAVDAIITIDENGFVDTFNKAAEEIFGYRKEEVNGQNIKMLMPSPERENHDVYLQSYLHSGNAKIIGAGRNVTGLRKDGTTFPMSLAVSEVMLGDRRLFTGIIRDITRQQEMEETLRFSKEQAEAANVAKSQFLANMSHEIRTPMNVFLGFTEILKEMEDDPTKVKYLENIHSSGHALLHLINDILDLSKIEADKLELQYSPTSLQALLQEMQTLFNQKIVDKGLEFSVEFDKDMPNLLILDETRLRQVLINLIGNAVKFTDNGYIRLSAFLHKTEEQTKQSSDLHIVVVDSGIGIPEDQQEKIFKAFEQQKDQQQKQYGGTGLGLSITKKIVELMGGTILVASQQEQGSRFEVILPGVQSHSMAESDDYLEQSLDPQSMHLEYTLLTPSLTENISITEDLLSVEPITPENRNKLPQLLQLLEGEVKKKWDQRTGLSLQDTVIFASELKQLGEQYQYSPLLNWGKLLREAAEIFDIEATNKIMLIYPEIVQKLSDGLS
ncbi:MAG: PAS domain S-box protein [SAR324 cluster bacterium]|nr:PAS domain S-box protein [SAR324 cluster bacterium]